MKTIINKTLLFLLTIVIALLSGYFIYQSYVTYKSYKIAQGADKYISYIDNTNQLLKKVENECASSALYLGKNGKMDFSKIEKLRDETDSGIKKANQFIIDNPKFLSNLQYVRSRVDVISSDYQDILFTYYQDEISNTLLKGIKENSDELSLGVDKLKNELSAYSNFIKYRNSIAKEKSFITYILSSSKKMSQQDMLLWDSILGKDRFPKSSNIQENLRLKKFSTLEQNIRLKVARGITTGNYEIGTDEWGKKTDKKVSKVTQSEEKVYDYIQSQITNETSTPKALIYNIAISIFLLLTLFSLIGLQKSKVRKRKYNQDIVKKSDKDNKEVFRKKRMTDIAMANTLFDGGQNQEFQSRATDIPLTNSKHVDKPTDKTNKTTIKTFNPMEEFAHIINRFTNKTNKKDIGFKYKIDPTIPTYCIGDIDKIHKSLDYLLDYINKSSKSKTFIELDIDNIAQTKVESAIRFSVKQNNAHFTKDEIKEIRNARYISFDNSETIKLNKAKDSLKKVSQLVNDVNGNFQINSGPKNETDFLITINLRRE